MRNFIFLMLVFVVFPFAGLIALNAILNFAGPVACGFGAVLLIGVVIAFIDYSQANILD